LKDLAMAGAQVRETSFGHAYIDVLINGHQQVAHERTDVVGRVGSITSGR
jgi:hypothetical protein